MTATPTPPEPPPLKSYSVQLCNIKTILEAAKKRDIMSTYTTIDGHSSQQASPKAVAKALSGDIKTAAAPSAHWIPCSTVGTRSTKGGEVYESLETLQAQRAALVTKVLATSPSVEPLFPSSEDERGRHAVDASRKTINDHISRLKKYNEIKDIAQGLLGLIAERRGVRIAQIMEELGMDASD